MLTFCSIHWVHWSYWNGNIRRSNWPIKTRAPVSRRITFYTSLSDFWGPACELKATHVILTWWLTLTACNFCIDNHRQHLQTTVRLCPAFRVPILHFHAGKKKNILNFITFYLFFSRILWSGCGLLSTECYLISSYFIIRRPRKHTISYRNICHILSVWYPKDIQWISIGAWLLPMRVVVVHGSYSVGIESRTLRLKTRWPRRWHRMWNIPSY